jgi:hypothetical protein
MKRASETHLQEVYDTEPRGFDDGNEAPRVGGRQTDDLLWRVARRFVTPIPICPCAVRADVDSDGHARDAPCNGHRFG